AAREDGARENEETVSRLEAISDAPTRQLPWGLFAALLLVVALALSLWSHRQRQHTKQPGQSTPTTSAAQGPMERLSGQAPGQVPGQVSSEVSGKANGAGSTATGSRTVGSASSAAPKSSENSAPA